MKTLYLFPTLEESVAFCRLKPSLREQIVVVGVGMAAAGACAAKTIARCGAQRVVLAGIAGALSEGLKVGEVVCAVKDSVCLLPEAYRQEYASAAVESLRRVSSITVSRTAEAIGQPYDIEQMEGAAVAAVCESFGVELFYHIRSISNYVGAERSEWRIAEAVESLGEWLAANEM